MPTKNNNFSIKINDQEIDDLIKESIHKAREQVIIQIAINYANKILNEVHD